jgi:hypothetical protein
MGLIPDPRDPHLFMLNSCRTAAVGTEKEKKNHKEDETNAT